MPDACCLLLPAACCKWIVGCCSFACTSIRAPPCITTCSAFIRVAPSASLPCPEFRRPHELLLSTQPLPCELPLAACELPCHCWTASCELLLAACELPCHCCSRGRGVRDTVVSMPFLLCMPCSIMLLWLPPLVLVKPVPSSSVGCGRHIPLLVPAGTHSPWSWLVRNTNQINTG